MKVKKWCLPPISLRCLGVTTLKALPIPSLLFDDDLEDDAEEDSGDNTGQFKDNIWLLNDDNLFNNCL
jgi:hypothetical protein